MKYILTLLLCMSLLFSCSSEKNHQTNTGSPEITTQNEVTNEKISVSTSILPLASITNFIGEKYVQVHNIIPAGVSPHNFDMKPKDMQALINSKLIISIGLEHIDGFLEKLPEQEHSKILSISKGIEFIHLEEGHHHDDEDKDHKDEHENDEDEHHDDEEHNEDKEGHDHNLDPHVWNSPDNAIIIAEKITEKLADLSPENVDYFKKNYKEFTQQIKLAKSDFETFKKGKEEKYFIVFHDAYNYLFEDLKISNDKKIIFRKSVLDDPKSQEMKELLDEIEEHKIHIAYKEPQFNDNNFQKIAGKYQMKILNLNPLGTNADKDNYIETLKNNLKNLEEIYTTE